MARPTYDESTIIEVRQLTKSYGEVRAVGGVDLRIARGEVFAMLGPNGAGKTSTVEILEGYRQRDSGEVRVLGLDPGKQGRRVRQSSTRSTSRTSQPTTESGPCSSWRPTPRPHTSGWTKTM